MQFFLFFKNICFELSISHQSKTSLCRNFSEKIHSSRFRFISISFHSFDISLHFKGRVFFSLGPRKCCKCLYACQSQNRSQKIVIQSSFVQKFCCCAVRGYSTFHRAHLTNADWLWRTTRAFWRSHFLVTSRTSYPHFTQDTAQRTASAASVRCKMKMFQLSGSTVNCCLLFQSESLRTIDTLLIFFYK